MKRMKNVVPIVLSVVLTAGCNSKQETPAPIEVKSSAEKKTAEETPSPAVATAAPAETGAAAPGVANTAEQGWKAVAKAMPGAKDGWVIDVPATGTQFQKGAHTAYRATLRMKHQYATAKITIADDVQAATGSMMGIAMAPAMSSEREQIEKITVQENPGMKSFTPKTKSSTLLIVVKKRFVVTINLKGVEDTKLGMALANMVDYTYLLSLI